MARPELSLELTQPGLDEIKASTNRTIRETRIANSQRKQAMKRAVVRKELSFLIARPTRSFVKERRVFLISSDEGKYVYFASAIVDSKISNLLNGDLPFDFQVKEGRDINNQKEVTLSLAEFVNEHFPQAKGLPLALYASSNHYRVRKPYSKYSYPEDFTTKE